MAVQNHVHFQRLSETNVEANKYHIRFDGSWDDTPTIPVTVDRALDTTLHYATVLDSSGEPKRVENSRMTISFMTRAEADALIALIARPIYFIPIDHSDDGDTDHATDRRQVVLMLKPNSLVPMDAACTYWCLGIEIIDND